MSPNDFRCLKRVAQWAVGGAIRTPTGGITYTLPGGGVGSSSEGVLGQFGAVGVVPRSWMRNLFVPERLGVRKRKGGCYHVLLAFSRWLFPYTRCFRKAVPIPLSCAMYPCSAVLHTFIASRPRVSPSGFFFYVFLWPGFFSIP